MEKRSVTLAVGILFTALGLLIAWTAENGLLSCLAAICVGGMGIDAVDSAMRNRRSLLSRIGPLP